MSSDNGVFKFAQNSLTSLEGIPPVVPGILDIGANPLESLGGLVEASVVHYRSTNRQRATYLGSTLKSINKLDTNIILLRQEATEADFRITKR